MPFKGVLKKGASYMVEVASGSTEKIGMTLLKINRRDKIAAAEPVTIAAGATVQTTDDLGTGIDRLIIMVNLPSNGHATVRITQGAHQFADAISADTQFAFDVEA